jgi:tRNA pseudouridine32 synthase/23S rRNA pseudouridine746 synthase
METTLRKIGYAPPLSPYIDICHEDADILICNKPSGLLSVPGRAENMKDCLETRLKEQVGEVYTVHRLDMETSGLIVYARNAEMQKALNKIFMDRKVDKEYIADIYGEAPGSHGTIDLPLICDWPNRPKQMVDYTIGKHAITHWTLLSAKSNTSRVLLKPITGRSHQLRVHMQALGHPILGDSLYAPDEAYTPYSRLHLHAANLCFIHPKTGNKIDVVSESPF